MFDGASTCSLFHLHLSPSEVHRSKHTTTNWEEVIMPELQMEQLWIFVCAAHPPPVCVDVALSSVIRKATSAWSD